MNAEQLLEHFESELLERQKQIKKDKLKTQKFGAIYTPPEATDYSIKSACESLQKQYGKWIDDPQVELLDPFTGTGNFLWRALLIEHPKGQYMMDAGKLEEKVGLGGIVGVEINYESLKIAKRNVDIALEFRTGKKLKWMHAICTDTLALDPSTDFRQLVEDNEDRRTEDGIVVVPPGDEAQLRPFQQINGTGISYN